MIDEDAALDAAGSVVVVVVALGVVVVVVGGLGLARCNVNVTTEGICELPAFVMRNVGSSPM